MDLTLSELKDLARKHRQEKVGKALMLVIFALESAVQDMNAEEGTDLDDDEVIHSYLAAAKQKTWVAL
jgi:hypothetical protein